MNKQIKDQPGEAINRILMFLAAMIVLVSYWTYG